MLLAHLLRAPLPCPSSGANRVGGEPDIQVLTEASGLLSAVAAFMEGQKAPGARSVAAWPHHRAGVLRRGHVGALAHGCVGTLVHGASVSPTGQGQGQPPGHGTSCSRVTAAQEFGDRALSPTWFLEFLTTPWC